MDATFSVEGRLMSERALDDPMAFADDEAADETLWNREPSGRNHNGLDNDQEHADLAEWDFGDDNEPTPPRGWLLGNLLCRQFLSLIFADGAVGKTSLLIVMALSLATGRELLNEHVFVRSRPDRLFRGRQGRAPSPCHGCDDALPDQQGRNQRVSVPKRHAAS
jgi:AAA domain